MADFSVRFYHGENLNPNEICFKWQGFPGSNIPMQFFKNTWVELPGSNIPMQWTACPDVCGIWKEVNGDQIVFEIPVTPWEAMDGDKVIVSFPSCNEETPDPEKIEVDFFEGATLETGFQETLLFNFYEGQALGVSVETIQIVELGYVDAYTGESIQTTVSATYSLAGDAFTGEALRPSLTTIPVVYFDPRFYTGETLAAGLAVSTAFTANAYTGEWLNTALTTFPAALLEPRAYAGESVTATVQASRLLAPTAFYGESVAVDVEVFPNQGMPMEIIGQGETLDASVQVSPGFQVRIYDGQTIATTLATQVALSTNFYEGQNLTPGVDFHPPWQIEPTFYHGENLGLVLGLTYTKIISLQFTGETLSAGLSTYPKLDMPAFAYTGERATLETFQLPLNLANGNDFFKHGEMMQVSVDEEPNIYFRNGQSLEVDLSTSFALYPRPFQEGARAFVSMVFRDPIYLGNTDFHCGEQMDVELKVQLAAKLYVMFRQTFVTRTDIDSTADFDMATVCCSGEPNNRTDAGDELNLELEGWEQPTTRYDGDKTKVEGDLWTLPRFQVHFYEGHQTEMEAHYVDLGPLFLFEGQTMGNLAADDDQNVMLCRGNFIPDADNVVIELAVDEENCSADAVFFDGYKVDIVPTFTPHMSVDFYEGQQTGLQLIANGPYFVDIEDGTWIHDIPLITDETAFGVRFYNGESAKTFHQEILFDDIHFNEGQAGIVTELQTSNSVEFLENGCLPNEFVPVKPSGDPDWDKFNPVPVEEDNYRHEIKAKCNN